jgi:hypothetical protein
VRDRDFVGALRRRQNGDDDADNGDGDDDADRDHHAQAGAVPMGVPLLFGGARRGHNRQNNVP